MARYRVKISQNRDLAVEVGMKSVEVDVEEDMLRGMLGYALAADTHWNELLISGKHNLHTISYEWVPIAEDGNQKIV